MHICHNTYHSLPPKKTPTNKKNPQSKTAQHGMPAEKGQKERGMKMEFQQRGVTKYKSQDNMVIGAVTADGTNAFILSSLGS